MIRRWQAGLMNKRYRRNRFKRTRRVKVIDTFNTDPMKRNHTNSNMVAGAVAMYGAYRLHKYLTKKKTSPDTEKIKGDIEEEAWFIIESYISEFPDADIK